jgi:hypothetical protein
MNENCHGSAGLVADTQEEFQDNPRCLCMTASMDVLPILLTNICQGLGLPAVKFTVSRWIGSLHYEIDEVVELEFKKVVFCRHDGHADIYELEMAFSAKKFPKVAKWLMVEGDNVSLFGYLLVPGNHIRLYIDRKYAAAVLDYQKTVE